MSLKNLSERLAALSSVIEENEGKLGGKALVKSAKLFEGQLAKFEDRIGDAVQGSNPQVRELQALLTGPDRKLFTVAACRAIYRKALGKNPPPDSFKTPSSAVKTLVSELKSSAKAKLALAECRQIISKSTAPKGQVAKDEERLRLEMNRLGALDDEQRQYELETRYRKISDLKALASANGIKLPKGITKQKVLKSVIARAQRVRGHYLG
ncbi:MAG: hypothetical protein AAF558_13815 [Verrucomicrobiota bacterium]